MRPKRSRAAATAPMRQRVSATLDPSALAGRSKKRGRLESLAARCSRWLVLRSSFSIVPATAAGAAERKASSIAHRASFSSPASTRIRRAGSRPKSASPCPCGRPQRANVRDERTSKIGPGGMRPRMAAAKPKAAGMSSSDSGATSCSAP